MNLTPMLKTVRSLRPSTTLTAAAAGLLSSAVFYGLFVYGLFAGSYLHEIFADRGTIPFITTFLFFWGVFLLVSAWLGVRREEATFEAIRGTIRGYPKIGQEHAPDVIEELAGVYGVADRAGLAADAQVVHGFRVMQFSPG